MCVMMYIMKKKFINILKKSVPLFFAVVIILTVIISSLYLTVDRHKSAVLDQYLAKYIYILDGYSKAVDFYLENYQTNLKFLWDEGKKEFSSEEDIFDFLKSIQSKAHPDFSRIFYADSNSSVYFADGATLKFPINTPEHSAFMNNLNFFISPLINGLVQNSKIFMVYIPIFNKQNKVTGVFGATINVTTINPILQNLEMHDGSRISLIDQQGQFLFHQDINYIGKKYIPKSDEYKEISSNYIADLVDGHIITESTVGEKIDLFFKEISKCNWTLLISVPATRKEDLYSRFSKLNTLLITLTLIGVLIIVTQIGFHIHSIYQNKLKSISIDPLTNIWTRTHFEQEAEKLIRKYPDSKFMLVEGDIRGFKFINQNFGGETADQVIIFFANCLKEHADQLQGILGRGFADHFYFFIKISSVHKAMAEFKKQNEILNEKIKTFDISFFPKFGITFLKNREDIKENTIQELIGQASFAKSTIKDNMLIQYTIYNSKLLEEVNKERFIENNMESALENEEFFVMYQPKIELLTDKVVGAEALVRWNSPKLGVVYPDEFIPLFERNGFIKKLDFYVYNKVFTFLQKQLDANEKVVPISVNMSRNHSKPEKFMHEFLSIFNKYHLPSNLVEVEILERSFMNGNTLKEFTELLHKEGFTVAMDDFGSGESSLNMLTQIPVDVLKFDRTFLYSATQNGSIDETSANFIETLIELGKNLKKQTIFEGVETQEQLDFLRSVECDQVQGYFFSKPLTEIDFVNFLKKF